MMYLSRLIGTLQNVFKIGQVLLKNTGGTLYVRDSGDSADAPIHASAITLTSGASNGSVLTSDASGNASWKPASGSATFQRALGGDLTVATGECLVVASYLDIPDGVTLDIEDGGEVAIV